MNALDPQVNDKSSAAHRMPAAHPFVSVVIPAHNEEKFISKCIASVIATQWPANRLEILVIDHRSTDATADIARQAGATVLAASQDLRIGGVRNVGLSAAKGEFVAFVDADCTVPATWLSSAISILRSNSRVGAVGGGPALSPCSGTWVERSLAPTLGTPAVIREANTLVTYSFIARTQLLRELGEFNDIVMSGEDDDMSNRIRNRGLTLLAVADCRVIHFGFPRTLSQVIRKEMWHGSNHIEVRSRFDATLTLTGLFIAASIAVTLSIIAIPALQHRTSLALIITCLGLQLLPPALFALKKLKRSHWQWSLALSMVAVGYAYFIGHSIGVLGNVYRRLLSLA